MKHFAYVTPEGYIYQTGSTDDNAFEAMKRAQVNPELLLELEPNVAAPGDTWDKKAKKVIKQQVRAPMKAPAPGPLPPIATVSLTDVILAIEERYKGDAKRWNDLVRKAKDGTS